MRILILLFLFLSLSCKDNSQETTNATQQAVTKAHLFDASKWKIKKEDAYPYRSQMLDDLVYNVPLKGLAKEELLTLLGSADRTDGDYLFYTIEMDHVMGYPLNSTNLVIKIGVDGKVAWRKIHK